MKLPAPIEAFIAAAEAGEGFSVEYAGWRVSAPAKTTGTMGLAGLSAWVPGGQLHVDRDSFGTARELGITAAEVARATARVSDIASLARPMPEFEEDPLAEDDGAERPPLTDQARADFAAAVAPATKETTT